MKNIIFLITIMASISSYGAITATDPNGEDFNLNLAPGQATTLQIQINADDGDVISSTRAFGAGLTFITSCTQSFTAPNLDCLAELDVSATVSGRKRVEFRTDSGQRLRVNVIITRDEGDPIAPGDYNTVLTSSVGGLLDFGTVSDKVNQRIYITNTSNQPTETIAPISLKGEGFSVINNSCSGRVIRGGNTCRLIIEFDSAGLFAGDFLDQVRVHPISDNSSPLTVNLEATVAAPPMAIVEVEAGISKIDPTACLSLGGVNPSECYYEADLPATGQTTIGSVSCNGGTPNQCSVLVTKKIVNEPVEFLITINYTDEVVAALNPSDFSHTITPATVSLGPIALGDNEIQTMTVTNTSIHDMPLPINIMMAGAQGDAIIENNTCETLTADLPPNGTCTFDVKITPTVIYTNEPIIVKAIAATNEEQADLTVSSKDSTVQVFSIANSSFNINQSSYIKNQDQIIINFSSVDDLGNPMTQEGPVTASVGGASYPLMEVSTGVYSGGPFALAGVATGPQTVELLIDGSSSGLATIPVSIEDFLAPVALVSQYIIPDEMTDTLPAPPGAGSGTYFIPPLSGVSGTTLIGGGSTPAPPPPPPPGGSPSNYSSFPETIFLSPGGSPPDIYQGPALTSVLFTNANGLNNFKGKLDINGKEIYVGQLFISLVLGDQTSTNSLIEYDPVGDSFSLFHDFNTPNLLTRNLSMFKNFGFLVAGSSGTSYNLYKIDQAGTMTTVGQLDPTGRAYYITNDGNSLYYVDSSGNLMKSIDGISFSHVAIGENLGNVSINSFGSEESRVGEKNGMLYFSQGTVLRRLDLSTDSISTVANISGTSSSPISAIHASDGNVYVVAGSDVISIDPNLGVVAASKSFLGPIFSPTIVGDRLVFYSIDPSNTSNFREVYIADGNSITIQDWNGDPSRSSSPRGIFKSNGRVYIAFSEATVQTDCKQLYRTDGTIANSQRIVLPGEDVNGCVDQIGSIQVRDKTYISLDDNVSGNDDTLYELK